MVSWERRQGGPALADYAMGHRVKIGLWLGASYQNKARHFKKLIKGIPLHKRASLVAQRQESACHCKRLGFNLCIRKIPWRRKWLPVQWFLPRKSPGQRNLAGYSSWGHRVRHNWVTSFSFKGKLSNNRGSSLGYQLIIQWKLQTRREWQDIGRVMRGKNLQPKLFYPGRISFRFKGEIKSFADMWKLSEFKLTL